MRRRDRILQSAVVAALAMVPPVVKADLAPTLAPTAQPDGNLAVTNTDGIGAAGLVSPFTDASWLGPFFTLNNGSTVVGSWNLGSNWSGGATPNAGGVATFTSSGDL